MRVFKMKKAISLRSVSGQSQVSLRSVSGQFHVSRRSLKYLCACFVRQTEPKILRLVYYTTPSWLKVIGW